MHCLIVVFAIVVAHRPLSIIHHLSPIVSRPSLVVSICRPLSAVLPSPHLPPFLLDIIAATGFNG